LFASFFWSSPGAATDRHGVGASASPMLVEVAPLVELVADVESVEVAVDVETDASGRSASPRINSLRFAERGVSTLATS
jgi:hypothetical protein